MKFRLLLIVLMTLGLAACGGGTKDSSSGSGNGDGGTGGGGTAPPTNDLVMRMDVMDAGGTFIPPERLTAGEPYTLIAVVDEVDDFGKTIGPVSGVIVAFATDGGTFDPAKGDALTSGTGEAQVIFEPTFNRGAYVLTVDAEDAHGRAVSLTQNYEIEFPDLKMGWGTPFVEGDLGSEQSTLSAGGSTNLMVRVIHNGSPYNRNGDIIFTSGCIDAGRSTVTTPAPLFKGTAEATYTSITCEGEDEVLANLEIDGVFFGTGAGGILTIKPAQLGGISFVSAEPASIVIQGSGSGTLKERSEVTFLIKDTTGQPSTGTSVHFSLNTTQVGGATLSAETVISDAEGKVSVELIAGHAAAVVRVVAEVLGTGTKTLSQAITISTGQADQDSFSISATLFNTEGWDFDGETSEIIIRVADLFNNPVPDGTQILFNVEGGAVPAACAVTGGVCSVEWTSQNPRPADGRLTLLARTVGTESFNDVNGNGLYDAGEPFGDLQEAYRDENEDGKYNEGEFFGDFNNNNVHDDADGKYNGTVCGSGGSCGNPDNIEVRESIVLVMSTSSADIRIFPSVIDLSNGDAVNVLIQISDRNGNLPPAGSKIEITTTNGELDEITIKEVGNSNSRGPISIPVFIRGDGEASSGRLTVTLTTPNDVVTIKRVVVTDDSEGAGVVALLSASPSTIKVSSNSTQQKAVVLTVTDENGDPVEGQLVGGSCDDNGNELAASIVSAAGSTDSNGIATAQINITAGANPTVNSVCTFTAAGLTADVVITADSGTVAGPPATMVVRPADYAEVANATTPNFHLFTTIVDSSGVPIEGFNVVGSCTNTNATDINVSLVSIGASNADGQSTIIVDIITGAAPSGSSVCTFIAGSATGTFTVHP